MPEVTYIESDGRAFPIDVAEGDSVMRGAVANGIEGVVADCGGALACATCHCYVDPVWLDRLPPPSQAEDQLLEATASERRAESRLSCQIVMTAELGGLVVRLPQAQF